MKAALIVLVAFSVIASAPLTAARWSQQKPTVGPVFDVVSIRHDPSSRCCLNNRSERPGGGYTLVNGTVAVLIGGAYGVLSTDIEGLPEWATSEPYDVIATGSLVRATRDDRRAMKQALLADRFQFRAHFEMRERPSFDLVKARSDGRLGAGLTPYEVDCHAVALASQEAVANGEPPPPESVGNECSVGVSRTGLAGAMPIWLLANLLRSVVGREVVDKTGMAGTFRVRLTFDQPATARADAAPSDTLPSLFQALPEQLGLKLEPSRAQVRVLVVDTIERPTPN